MADKSDTVAIGYVHPDKVSTYFHHSLVNLLMHDAAHGQRVVGKIAEFSSANISNARNVVVQKFLTETTADWLWMVDTDMVFPPDTLEGLLHNADPVKAPFVGGLCFGGDDGRLWPTLYAAVKQPDGSIESFRYNNYPPDSMFRVLGTGAACTLVHRSVYEAVKERGYNQSYPWYQETEWAPGKPCGEDITFCLRAGQLGVQVWVNTAVKLGHHKSAFLDEPTFRLQTPVAEPEEAR